MTQFLSLPRLIGLVGFGFVTLAATRAQGQVVGWLDFDGLIPGDATDRQHPHWIDVRGLSVGAIRGIGPISGARPISAPALDEISLTKSVDGASSRLFLAAVAGKIPYPKVTLDLNSGLDQPLIRLELENVLVSAQSSTTSGEADAIETISLNFEKITYIHIQPDSSTQFASYDLRTQLANSGTGSLSDADHDGMPDSWETGYNLAVGVDDANGDADGDGLSNLHEYQLRTNPQSGSSFFKAVLTTRAASPGTCDVTWNSVVGKTYVIEWSPDLTTPFTALRTVAASTASTTETLPRTGPLGFFRVRPL